MAGSVEFLGRLENRLRTQGSLGVVAGEKGLEFADNFLGGSFRDQIGLCQSTSRNITQ